MWCPRIMITAVKNEPCQRDPLTTFQPVYVVVLSVDTCQSNFISFYNRNLIVKEKMNTKIFLPLFRPPTCSGTVCEVQRDWRYNLTTTPRT